MSNLEIDNYELVKTISDDSKVKIDLYKNKETQKKFVLKKFLNKKSYPICRREYQIHKKLNHKNIIKASSLILTNNTLGIKMEYAELGDFFNIISREKFSENLSRYYSIQILNALLYLKNNDITHRDLKLENIFLTKDFQLKLADFGLSSKYSPKTHTLVGTKGYMAPEFYDKKIYDSEKSDVFAFGVILFILVLGVPPFEHAVKEDRHYRCFLENKKVFWQYHSRIRGDISESFVIMINNLLSFRPKNRFTFEQLSKCYWMNKSINDSDALKEIKSFFN